MSRTPDPSNAARALQKLSAAAIKGTPAAAERASVAGSSVSRAAARMRSQKAHAARWGKKAAP